ncbi:MAG: hypothetical protein ACXWP0_01175 [Ktedonobacterales bacterium]
MDTQEQNVKTITVGSLGYQYDVVSERHGQNVTLSLTTKGNLVVSLTPEGEQELADRLEQRAQDEARNYKYIFNDEEILGELCEDLQGNGIGYTSSLDAWGHMTESAGFSDDYTVEDDGTIVADRVWWMPDYMLYPTTLDRLMTGKLVFEWGGEYVDGKPSKPNPMRIW